MPKVRLINIFIGASLLSIGSLAVAAETPAATKTAVAGGTVHFTGQIVNAACAVSGNSTNKPVNLGQYRSASFKAVGDYSGTVPFTIELDDCDPTVSSSAAVAFNGVAASTDPTVLSVGSGGGTSGSAGGVGIEISDAKGKVLPPDGASFSSSQSLNVGKNVLNFSARYKSTLANVTPGQADADATFTMQYQ